MMNDDTNANDKGKKPKKKKINSPTAEGRPLDNTARLMELFKLIKAFPLKTLLLASTVIGGLLVVGYFDYINYQPDLNPVHFSFLAAQAFVAGLLVAIAFLTLFVSALMSSNSPAADASRKENSDPKGRVTAFFLVVLSHFPILFFAYAKTSSTADNQHLWWIGLSAWTIVFGLLSFFRYKMIRRAHIALAANDSIGTTDDANQKHDNKIEDAECLGAINHETSASTEQPKKKTSPAWAMFAGELLTNFTVMMFSAPALLLLLAIMEASPVSPNNGDLDLWMMWLMIGVTSGICSTGKSIPGHGKMLMLGSVIFLILSYLQAVHLPVVAVARIAGFGQIADADLTLSDRRCAIVQQQLTAAGMPNRLVCQEGKRGAGEEGAMESQSPSDNPKTAGVLKKALILSRAGSAYYVEISKGLKPAAMKRDKPSEAPTTANALASASTNDKPADNTSDARLEKEDVVRFSIPKSDADDLVPMTRTLSTHEAEQYRKKLKGKL